MAAYTISKFTAQDKQETLQMMRTYTASLGIDLAHQGLEKELANLPGKYSPPSGAILVARSSSGEAIGCVALRDLGEGYSEMKRLYVTPEGRGLGVGISLAKAIIEEAKPRYRAIRLDTLSTMKAARRLYQSLGFVEIKPYYDSPIEETLFLELRLQP